MRRFLVLVWLFVGLVVLPSTARAQGAFAGVVKDTSGGVLPGVTVEASSPELIEKVRTVVTDGTGQYKIVNLVPGTYTLTFTLTGLTTVKMEGLVLSGSATVPIDAEMRVGALAETITVTSETPVVDVQTTTKQRVVDHVVIDAVPAARDPFAFGVLVPGMSAQLSGGQPVQDVGGANLDASLGLSVHGGRQADQVFTQSGIATTAQAATGSVSRLMTNMAAVQEVTLDYSAVSAELSSGGVRINLIPRDGGNTFKGTFFGAFANESMSGSNFTQALKDAGLSTPNSIKKNWDANPGFGGPIEKDKLWFYASVRTFGASNYVAGVFPNLNANNPKVWTYAPDTGTRVSNDTVFNGGDGRLAWQASPKNKIGFSFSYQNDCQCPQIISATVAPEADQRAEFPLQRKIVLDWSSPVTGRLLLEAGTVNQYGLSNRVPAPGLDPQMISVTEQSTGLKYRGGDPGFRLQNNLSVHYRFAASYITGTHAYKVGITHNSGYFNQTTFANQPLAYRFNNGVPNQLTELAYPFTQRTNTDHNMGVFAQDTWTRKQLTIGYGVRYDYYGNGWPEQQLGPTPLTPTRNITFPAASNLSWHDVTPKLGASYDLFGDRKTAIKVSLNKYLENLAAGSGLPNVTNPTNSLISSTTRSWTDSNGNFVPDCDLLNTAKNGECGALTASNFGQPASGSTYDPNLLTGWGKRGFNWEFSVGMQREIMPRVSMDISYFRRWYGNFLVTDNLATAASDYSTFSLAAPLDPRLPGGGGYNVSGLYDLNPNKVGLTNNFVTRSDTYGNQIEHWNGIDITMNARPRAGMLLQGGISTGRTTTDMCDVAAAVPEALLNPSYGVTNSLLGPLGTGVWLPQQYCHQQTPFQTQLKLLGTYTVPKIDLQVSGTMQSIAGQIVNANYIAANALVAPALGRSLSNSAANITFDLVSPGSMFTDRLNQLDLRFGKILRVAGTRTALNLDLYNVLNTDATLAVNSAFASWQRPTSIVSPRFAKISVQFDF